MTLFYDKTILCIVFQSENKYFQLKFLSQIDLRI